MARYSYEPCACKQGGAACGGIKRRDFLKRAVAAGAAGMLSSSWSGADIEALYAAGRAGDARALEAALAAWTDALQDMGERRAYSGPELEHIAFPLGGIGAGQVYLLGDGRLSSWQIANNFLSGQEASGAFFALRAKTDKGDPLCRLLRRDPENDACVQDVVWSGEYPLAWLRYVDEALPVSVSLEAYSPFVPLNMKDSGLPAAIFSFTIHNHRDVAVEAALLASAQNLAGWDGYTALSKDGVTGPEFMGNENQFHQEERAARLSFHTQSGTMPALNKPLVLATHDRDVAYHLRLCKNLTVDLESKGRVADPAQAVFWFGSGAALPPDDAWEGIMAGVRQGAGLVFVENGDGLLRTIGQDDDLNKTVEVFEDFESGTYDKWTITGDCFGDAPARGALPNQQSVSGYQGDGLVNTYFMGDGATGKATSKSFTITRPYIHFLIGGGRHPGETCVNLNIGGRVVHTATGRNEEQLRPVVWDVSAYIGREGVIEIVDNHKGGWGHVNVDHIVFSDIAVSPHVSAEALRSLRETLPFSAAGVSATDTSAAVRVCGQGTILADLPPEYHVAGPRCVFENFSAGDGLSVELETETGVPLVFSAPCGKGRVVVCNGLALDALPGPLRKNIYGRLVALAADDSYTPQTGWPEDAAHYGAMTLCVLDDDDSGRVGAMAQWDCFDTLWDVFKRDGHLDPGNGPTGPSAPGRTWNGAMTKTVTLAPGETKTITIALSWYFPNRLRDHHYGRGPRMPQSDHRLGNMYNNWFGSADEVADYVLEHFKRLCAETHRYHETFYATTLPRYLLDALTANLATIRTPLYMWLEDGTIAGFEGTNACCPMNCTHVYNYAMTPAFLFPAMERNMRETDLLVQMHPTEHYIPHRTVLPLSEPRIGFEIGGPHHPALDGQFGTILKAYREYRQCGDRAWLKRMWPPLKTHLLYLMGHHDPEGTGVIRGEQPNTYDIHTYGSNTFIGTLYLAALRAMEQMAYVMNDRTLARQCRERFETGAAGYDETCWNGEYYINVYDAPDATPDTYNQGNCWGDGCHADQLLGQWWANLLDLGYMLPRERVQGALEAIHRHCWRGKLDLPEHRQRVFAEPWERGLLNCAWPKDGRPEHPVLYCDEVWTGIEYEVAAMLLHEGLIIPALQIVKGARDRYTGSQRNPYSEIECGGHYARAMASWSLLPAAAGFHYDAGEHALGFAPRIHPEAFTAFFTAADGYGLISQQRTADGQSNRIVVKQGSVKVKKITLDAPGPQKPKLRLRPFRRHRMALSEGKCVITLARAISLKAGQALDIELG